MLLWSDPDAMGPRYELSDEGVVIGFSEVRLRGGWSAGRILLLVIVAPVLLAIAWVVFQFVLGFLYGLLGG